MWSIQRHHQTWRDLIPNDVESCTKLNTPRSTKTTLISLVTLWMSLQLYTVVATKQRCRHNADIIRGRPPIGLYDIYLYCLVTSIESLLLHCSARVGLNICARCALFSGGFWRPVTLVQNFLAENWHTGYSCPVTFRASSDYSFLRFFVFE